MEGIVFVNGVKEDKAGTPIDTEAEIFVKGEECPYVSRGGFKLEKALKTFDLDLVDATCLDIGASTGGFTDCMLQNGAKKVFAVDVGTNQLAWKLRSDPRVISMEKVNARSMDPETIDKDIDFVSIDVSFISLKLIFPLVSKVLSEKGSCVCLVKPQFEAGREQVGKKGIVKDKAVHVEVVNNVISYANENKLYPHGLTFSPITGATGNIEYLMVLKKETSEIEINVKEIVENSHECLER